MALFISCISLVFFVSGEPVNTDFSQSLNFLCLITSCSALSPCNSFSPIHNDTLSRGGKCPVHLKTIQKGYIPAASVPSVSMGADKCLSTSDLMSDEDHCLYVSPHNMERERKDITRDNQIDVQKCSSLSFSLVLGLLDTI